VSFISQPITLQSLFGKKRKIGDINVNVVMNEVTNDTLTITKQPVQQGASITDHAYKEPTVFSMAVLFEDNLFVSLSKVYQNLLDLQNSRAPFDVITPKRIYRNVLIATLGQTTDKKTENCLAINLTFQEILIVNVVTTSVPRSKQRNPGATGATQNAGKKSALLSVKQGIGSLLP
jgi:hypothetical protein